MVRELSRGEVRWYRFSSPPKRRPVLVLTRQSAMSYLAEVTVAPITTRIRELPTEVRLDRGDGMPRPCVVNLDHLRSVPKARLGARLAALSPTQMEEVRAALLFALGFDP